MSQAETRNRFADIDSALLTTEYDANIKARDELEAVIKEQRDEIENRLKGGLTVANSKIECYLQYPKYKTYNVDKAITQIRKHKIAAASLLQVINGAVKKLPKEIRDCIPYIEEEGIKVMRRAR